MPNLLIVFVVLFMLVGDASAQRSSPPRFRDFHVTEEFRGRPARVNLDSHPQARMFRTMLRDTAKLNPNFSGHFAVKYWGCGTECIRIGIVDLKTGRCYVSQFYASVGIATRIDSRLLVVAPPEMIKELYGDDAPDSVYPRYYVWKDNRLSLIYPESDKGKAEIFWKTE